MDDTSTSVYVFNNFAVGNCGRGPHKVWIVKLIASSRPQSIARRLEIYAYAIDLGTPY